MPELMEDWNSSVRAGASSSASSLRILGVIPSGPEALVVFRFLISFLTPASVMVMVSQVGPSGVRLSPVLASKSSGVQGVRLLNADWNWRFRVSAWPWASVIRRPSTFRGETTIRFRNHDNPDL